MMRFLHIVGLVGQVANFAFPFVPPKYQGLVAGVLAGLQGFAGEVQRRQVPPVK